jgi:hypothetical protein
MKNPTRKTFNVEVFRDKINWRLSNCFLAENELKQLCTTLEDVLWDTGNYGGFRYLRSFECPKGANPGIREGEDHSEWFKDTSSYRRVYF